MLLRTPFYNKIVAAGGKMVEFTGYELPVQFEGSGIIAEHNAVRQKAGLFDVSHMGEIYLSGKDALATIQNLVTNDMSIGTAQRTDRPRRTVRPKARCARPPSASPWRSSRWTKRQANADCGSSRRIRRFVRSQWRSEASSGRRTS